MIRSVNGGEAGSSGVLMFSSGSSSGYVYGKWLEPSFEPSLFYHVVARRLYLE